METGPDACVLHLGDQILDSGEVARGPVLIPHQTNRKQTEVCVRGRRALRVQGCGMVKVKRAPVAPDS